MIATEPSAIHNTFVIDRSYPQPPARVYAAFAQPAQKRRWYAEGDHEIQEFELDFRAGGSERFRYRFKEGHQLAGSEILNETGYQDIAPEERIVLTTRMTLNGKVILVQLVTLEFLSSGEGTELTLTNQGTFMDWPGGAEMIEAGWRSLLDRLGKEVASQPQ
jgi:uncharacterized protein YndB with AHSA1/START domain